MGQEIKPGETKRFDCPECSTEFDVTFEPKCAGTAVSAKEAREETDPQEVTTCPFCGGDLEGEEGEEDDEDE